MMIAVLMSVFLAAGKVKGDTLSTRGLAKDFRMFYHPPAVFLNQSQNAMWERNLMPLIFVSPFGTGSFLYRYYGQPTSRGSEIGPGGIKRNDENSRRKK